MPAVKFSMQGTRPNACRAKNAARAGGQHDAHALAFPRKGGDLLAQRERGPDQVEVGEGIALLILEDRLLEPVLP
jgi:hypothetical protein